jgi:dipeptidyl aminopeptidase/acylaminoacyl peptidase
VWDVRWSPDGRWLAYITSKPADSTGLVSLFVADAENPATTKLIGSTDGWRWTEDNNLLVYRNARTYLAQLDGSQKDLGFADSTFCYPILHRRYLLCWDDHSGKQGLWIAPLGKSGKSTAATKRVPTIGVQSFGSVSDGKLRFAINENGRLLRMSLPELRVEQLPTVFPGMTRRSTGSISEDGKEVVYVENGSISKIVLMQDVFK